MKTTNPISNPPSLSSLANSLLTHKNNQLVDSLTSHISLYNQTPISNPNSNPRSSILKWFTTLSIPQRQANLTIVDFKFVQLLIQMLTKIRSRGHGRFIILPELPTGELPGLCFKKSSGLLLRTAESNGSERVVFESVRLFSSREGERIEECSCSYEGLDSVTVCEEFVENVDEFVRVMDAVSNGEFLRGEESELGFDWVEFGWLKSKGYYSVEAFLVNRLEVALRLGWMNCGNGKKRVKLKEKVVAAGASANVFWRKKGCVDWWMNLDAETRRKFLNLALGKSAKSLTREIVKGASASMKDEMWLFREGAEQPLRYIYKELMRRPMLDIPSNREFGLPVMHGSQPEEAANFVNLFYSLLVVQDIVSLLLPGQHQENDKSKIFFSTLHSVSSVTDCILRKLRGLVMVISLDCTKIELLEEGNFKCITSKSKEKLSGGSRKKKGKTRNVKKLNPTQAVVVNESSVNKSPKKMDPSEFNGSPGIPHGKEEQGHVTSSAVKMEHCQRSVLGNGQNGVTKKRKAKSKGKNKNKNSSSNDPVEVRNLERAGAKVCCSSVTSSDEETKICEVPDNSAAIQKVSENHLVNGANSTSSKSPSSSANEPITETIFDQNIHECSHIDSDDASSNNLTVDRAGSAGIKTLNFTVDNHLVSHLESTSEVGNVASNNGINFRKEETEEKSKSADRSVRIRNLKEESSSLIQGRESKNYNTSRATSPSEYLSYEWPSLAPVYFPSITSHLPPATDRLHLDVGANWHNHIRQPFVHTVHPARSSTIENGYNRTLSRPLPMSLDWPPVVRSTYSLAPSMTCNYDSGFISRRQSFQQTFTAHKMQFNAKSTDDERKYSAEFIDTSESANVQELMDEYEGHWMSEEEVELHAVSGLDYNQYFGGGVMYWDPYDHPGTGFSRAPSHSSDDSTWALHEADMNRTVDDMVAFPSSYSTTGMASPTAASFCSSIDPLCQGHQTLGYVVSGNEVTDMTNEEDSAGSLVNTSSDIEGKIGDSLPYPILPPIIIPSMSREKLRPDYKRAGDHKSPCVPPSRREQPRIKRPPSPVVLCVPRAPRPPPPSPVSDTRKHRGLPSVRSGSSSPRHWSVRGWYHEGTNLEEACVRMEGIEVVWPSWRNKNISPHPLIQPLPGALLQDRLLAMSQLARDQEHPDVSFPLQPPELQSCSSQKASLSLMHNLLHDEIDVFCKQVASVTMDRKPFINWAVKRVTRSLQVLWPRSRTNIFGSNATGLSLPTSDVDLVVSLPPVRNLEPIKEAGILEGRNGIKETCLQHAARYLVNQEWVKNDSLKTVENTAIPIIMLVVEVPNEAIISVASSVQSPKEVPTSMASENENNHSDLVGSEDSISPKCSQINHDILKDVTSIRIDISFKSPSHTGLQTTELVKELTGQFPAATPLALVLKQFLADRSLDQSYSGGLSSYCLVLLITRFLQHEHHLGRPINQNWGSLLMDFLYFFGNVFDPRQMRISVQGSGVYMNRERGYSIDPIHIDDPLFPTNNVGRNCFRIHQCIKAFSEAYTSLENELSSFLDDANADECSKSSHLLLPRIIPSINSMLET
ncbi:Nucleotidyltransferase family protein [Euphorbia peplus]|nr:Nucleotidyltransferase family protein [Euphorbia peplus]